LRNGKLNWKLANILFLDEISMFDIKDFLKLDKYLRHFMAQCNPEAMNFLFGGLNIVLCGDFSQLNPIGRSVIYDRNANALWNLNTCRGIFGTTHMLESVSIVITGMLPCLKLSWLKIWRYLTPFLVSLTPHGMMTWTTVEAQVAS